MTATKEKPILFTGEMVRAILSGRKTQTRRVIKPQPQKWVDCYVRSASPRHWLPQGVFLSDPSGILGKGALEIRQNDTPVKCPYEVGMRLWVREGHLLQECVCQAAPAALRGNCRYCGGRGETVIYKADATCAGDSVCCRYRPSIHMPRWASRITLEITDIRVQRLQEISEEDAAAEGVGRIELSPGPSFGRVGGLELKGHPLTSTHGHAFCVLWDSINIKPGTRWEDSPWVWCLSFRRVEE